MEVGRWCERDKVVPLKKRRGSFERGASEEEETVAEKEKKTKGKTKTNKKLVQRNGEDEPDHGKEIKDGADNKNSSSGKKMSSKRGSVIMEGSRCSRVNGRGWRCCQQTLVGYSLCEHHLGKGRLRSMNSVRSRAIAAPAEKNEISHCSGSLTLVQEKQDQQVLSDDDDDDDDEEEDDGGDEGEKKPLMVVAKKRMKLGVVKARSISSLLGQPNGAALVGDNQENFS